MTVNCAGQPAAQTAAAQAAAAKLLASMEGRGLLSSAQRSQLEPKLSAAVTARLAAGGNASTAYQLAQRLLPGVAAGATLAASSSSTAPFGHPDARKQSSPSSAVATAGASLGGPSRSSAGAVAATTSGEDDDSFRLADWLKDGRNPMLLQQEIENARRLHADVVLPCTRYYKQELYGDPEHPIRLSYIIYGIVSSDVVYGQKWGGPSSRHVIGEAVNFGLHGVSAGRIVEDIREGRIQVECGVYAETNGVYATLPYTVEDREIRRLYLFQDAINPWDIDYKFT